MVANPFMSQLDFNLFYAANAALIEDYYAVIDHNGQLQYYNGITSTLPNRVAPMQAFLVELKTASTSLTANANMTVAKVAADGNIRSAQDGEDFYLRLEATQDGENATAFIKFNEGISNGITATFPVVNNNTRGISIYSRRQVR